MTRLIIAVLLTLTASALAAISVRSSFEAFTLSGQRCLGDCGTIWFQQKCLTALRSTDYCTPSYGKNTTHYKGLTTGYMCISDCDKFGNNPKSWCATGFEDWDWDYCSRKLALLGYETVQSNNKYSTCLDECEKRGGWYNTCHTGDDSWAYCDPSRKTLRFNNPTETGERCLTRCKGYYAGYENQPMYCYSTSKKWTKCFANPPPSVDVFGNISRRVNDECTLWTTSKDGSNLVRCTTYRRMRRQTPANELGFDCNIDVEDVLLTHQAITPLVEVRPFLPHNPITTDTNPILNYHVLETFSSFADQQEAIDVPLNIEAVITGHTIGNARESFTAAVNHNFNAMDVGISDPHRNFDERGHMIAARLGGPTTPYNIFPQTRWSNRGSGSPWFAMEAQIEAFVNANPSSRYVRMWVVLSYPVDGSEVLVHRPDAVGVRVRAYDGGSLVDLNGAPVTLATNPHESMFFTNDPARRCRA